ncbi:Crinkler effector [Pleurotus pulmonarius]
MSLAHTAWQHHTGPLYKVWQEWWGKSENEAKLDAGKVINFKSSTVNYAEPTRGRFIVREYHTSLFTSLQQVDPHSHGGVVISGQPGSGKSYTLLYLLLKMLIKREPILFLPVNAGAHYFSSDGVQYSSLVDETCLDELNDDENCTWALVNSDTHLRPPPSPLLAAFGIFIIQSTSPSRLRYKSWVKQKRGLIWYMERWTRDEIVQALTLVRVLPQRPLDELESSADKMIAKWGWAPRDIVAAIEEEEQLENALTEALKQLKTSSQLLELFEQTTPSDARDEFSHSIICLYQSLAGKPTVDFKSAYIRYRVQCRLGGVHREEALQLIRLCQPCRESSSLAGWAFENFVFDVLCSPGNEGDLFPPRPASASGTKWSLQIDPLQLASESTSASRVVQSSGLTRVTFQKTLDNVTLDDTKLFVPSQPNFPLLDAFFLQTFAWNFPGNIPEAISGDVYIQAARIQDPLLCNEEDESLFVEDA